MIGPTGVGADVNPDLISKVFGQVETMLPEFSNFALTVSQLLQWLLCDFRTAAAKLQTERAFVLTQRTILEELLW